MIDIQDELYQDIEAVRQIPVVQTMLEVICQTTGMGFAAVARVTGDRWVACSVRDEVQFGLGEGGELQLDTTLCNEVREYHQPIVIDHVAADPTFCNHHTPRIYGLQSYISFPIILKDGTFFGTLCAIDARPRVLNNAKTKGMFTLFAELLAFHLQSLDLLERSNNVARELKQKNEVLTSANFDLDSFVYTASHDLKSPVSNIEGLLEALSEALSDEHLDRGEVNHIIELMKSSLVRFNETIQDLTTIVAVDQRNKDEKPEELHLPEVVEHIKKDLQHLIASSGAQITIVCEENLTIKFSKQNFKSILYNLLNNAIKYSSPDRKPEVLVKMERMGEKTQVSVTDNGIGIPLEKHHKIFTMFKRLHDHVEGSGLGLYIVKRMVDHAGGQIQVQSTVNQGTTFTLIF